MKFRVINGTPAPAGPRQRARASADRNRPHCTTCGGHEYITARNGRTSAKLCVGCLMQGRRREMSVRD